MRKLEVTAMILLIIGGLCWGLIGFFDFDIIARIFERMPIVARIIFCLVGLAAIYQIFVWRPFGKRFGRK